jgi:hypothetical protein
MKASEQKVLWMAVALLAIVPLGSGPANGQVVSVEDFESFSDGDITLQGDPAWPLERDPMILNGIGIIEDSPGGDDERGKVLKKDSSSETHWFPQLGNETPDDDETGFTDDILRIELELWVTTDETRSFLLDARSGPNDTIYSVLARDGKDTINHVDNGSWQVPEPFDIPVDQWMNYVAILDQANDNFDLFIDGAQVFDDAGLWRPSDMLDRISWSSAGNNVIYLDNLCIAVGTEGDCPKGPPPPAGSLLGDANNDDQVTGADLISVQQNFGTVYPSDPSCDGLGLGDANDDCQVTGADLISVQQNFGKVAPTSAVPEPALAAGWMVLLAVGLSRRCGRLECSR